MPHDGGVLKPASLDVDLPLECDDDEFWDPADPQRAFHQPQGNPSTMTYWICYIKLMKILGAVLRAVVSSSDILKLLSHLRPLSIP